MNDTVPKIKIITNKGNEIILSSDKVPYHFENFKYTEDMNLGFPTIEFQLRDNMFELQREGLYGDEIIIVEEFIQDDFKLINKRFKIKSMASAGSEGKFCTFQHLKIIAIDENYDNILKNNKSIYFEKNEVKKISDLIKKMLSQVGISNTTLDIADTLKLSEMGFDNLYIPYSKDIMKVIRKLSNYSVTEDNKGGFIFFINKEKIFFRPIGDLFKNFNNSKPDIWLRLTDMHQDSEIQKLKLSTFNTFDNFIMGHEKIIYGFNNNEKNVNYLKTNPGNDYIVYDGYEEKQQDNYIDKMSTIDMGSGNFIQFDKDFKSGNMKSYYTPLDNINLLKGLSDSLYYAQFFKYNLDLELKYVDNLPDFKIGSCMRVDFFTNDDDPQTGLRSDKWKEINGQWMIKSFSIVYPSPYVFLKLVKIGSGNLPEKYIKI